MANNIKQSLSLEQFSKMMVEYRMKRGSVTRIVSRSTVGNWSAIVVMTEKGGWTIDIILTSDGLVEGLTFRDPPTVHPQLKRNNISISLPFRGEWYVSEGGPTKEQNYHMRSLLEIYQRSAIDLCIRDKQGSEFRNTGTVNEDYYCYKQTITAAAAGITVVAVDGVPDNKPGTLNPTMASGNTVIIKHGEHEFSVYAHLSPGTLMVKANDRLFAGQPIGLSGNSGMSSNPHLHFSMMNTDTFSEATGFPPYFEAVKLRRVSSSKLVRDYSPTKGDFIENN
jgi:hypothetical protein